MFVKSVSVAAAIAISILSVRAFAEPPATPQAPQVALVAGSLLAHPDRQLVNKTALAWPKSVPVYREAKVVLRYTVEPDGTVDHIETVFAPTNPAFAAAAAAAVSTWTYSQATAPTPNVEAIAYFHAPRN